MALRSALALLPLAVFSPQGKDAPIRGFTSKSSDAQRALEARLLDVPRAEACKEFLNVISEDPHVAGSEQDKKLADYVRARFLEYGFECPEPVTYEVLLSLPKKMEVTLVSPEEYKAKL